MPTTHNSLSRITLSMLAFLALFANNTSAQKGTSKFSASVTGGLAIPTGTFAANERVMLAGIPAVDGGAETGWNGNVRLSAGFSSKIWVTLSVGLAGFKRDDAAFEKILMMTYGNTPVANAGSWKIFKVLAGPSFRLPIGTRLTFRPALSAGIVKTAIPAYKFIITDQGGNAIFMATQSKIKMPAGFAYEGSAGLGYKLNSRFSLLADFSYFGASASYKFKPVVPGGSIGMASSEYKYDLNNFSAQVGVEVSF